jgi:hypothetical protein
MSLPDDSATNQALNAYPIIRSVLAHATPSQFTKSRFLNRAFRDVSRRLQPYQMDEPQFLERMDQQLASEESPRVSCFLLMQQWN